MSGWFLGIHNLTCRPNISPLRRDLGVSEEAENREEAGNVRRKVNTCDGCAAKNERSERRRG